MGLWSSQGDYKVLYTNLSDKDGGAVVAQLTQMNIPYKYADGGAAILVPAAQVHDVRLKLASAGLPKGSVVGFELMDGARFGQTQFQERLTFQRGLEGELTRSIQAMPSVEAARVHLALPNQNGFFREQQKPSASVMLTLRPGHVLDRSQVAGIVHLISSSVPELNAKAVSILDQNGTLLSQSPDGQGGLDEKQLQYVNQIESGYTKRILDLLEPVVGRDNLRATVTAEVDFSQTDATSEEFKPNQGANATAAVRSQQTNEQSGATAAPATGIPGAASNQPPQPATAPLNGAAQPLQTAQNGQPGSSSRRDNTTNFEVDKTVRVTRGAMGSVKRVNAAVVVNFKASTDKKGKTTQVALSPEEIENLTSLVRESVGFKQDRGDSVKVISAPFQVPVDENKDLPVWKQPETLNLLRTAAVPTGLALVALLVVFGIIRPAIKALEPPKPPEPERNADGSLVNPNGSQLNAVVGDDEELPGLEGPDVKAIADARTAENLERAKLLARENPIVVANILRGWVNGEPA
jgi:flagellar M-ring protein FliF